MKKDARGNVIELSKKVIPRDEKGDPSFPDLPSILQQFLPEEVTHMVNRYLYQAEYSRTVHRQRAREEAEKQAPLKAKIEELFGCRWTQATDAQILAAMKILKAEKEEGE